MLGKLKCYLENSLLLIHLQAMESEGNFQKLLYNVNNVIVSWFYACCKYFMTLTIFEIFNTKLSILFIYLFTNLIAHLNITEKINK